MLSFKNAGKNKSTPLFITLLFVIVIFNFLNSDLFVLSNIELYCL